VVSFAEPARLGLLALPAAAAILAVVRHRRRLAQQRRLAAPAVWQRLVGGIPATGLARMLAWTVGALLLVLAVARPQWGELPAQESIRSRDLAVALDLSDSMLCEDVRPSRLARSIETIQRLLPLLEGNRLAVVIFAGEAYPLVPLTTDLGAVAVFLEGVQPGTVALPGSNLQRAVEGALELLPAEGEGRVLLLFTDGENLQGDVEAATSQLQSAAVRMLGVVAGTERGGPIPEHGGQGSLRYKRDQDGQPVITRARPEVLASIAKTTDGEVVELADPEVVTRLAEAIASLQTREVDSTRTVRRVERFPVFLMAAAAFLGLGFAFSPWRRLAAAVFVLACSTAVAAQDGASQPAPPQEPVAAEPLAAAADPAGFHKPAWWQRFIPGGSRRLARQGLARWHAGDLERATEAFAGAASLDHERVERLYDLGTGLAAGGNLEASLPLLATADQGGVPGAAYNVGTAALQVQQLEDALEWLRRAMLADPDDLEAKHNYELALRQRQRQQQQQQQEQEQEQQQQEDERQQEQQPQGGDQQPPPQPEPQPTPDSNQPLFAALDRAEAEARDEMRSPTPAAGKVEKDW
jgi:Ca-activated chloride channel family protein